ncbi:MAG: ABC transporter ATP-binding protein [Pikeienuella sp.]
MKQMFSEMISPFDAADGPPPNRIWPFLRWSLKGAVAAVLIGGGVGFLAGAAESGAALFIGWIIDGALAHGREGYFEAHWPLLLAVVAFFLIIRPILLALGAAITSIGLAPNLFSQVVMRLGRHTLGQSLRFFDDDYAGRLAQKHLQAAGSVTEIVVEMVNAITFALATIIGAALALGGVDWRLAVVLTVWLISYVFLVRWFLPHIRKRAASRAEARAGLTGQVVDAFTNIATVKLFARSEHEEAGAKAAVTEFRAHAIEFGVIVGFFRVMVMTLAGALPVAMLGGAIWLWQLGLASAGDIAVAGVLSTRIAQMSGWISFVSMMIFSHLGEAEDGMRALSPSHELVDRDGAKAIATCRGEVSFNAVDYHYGKREGGGLSSFDLHIKPGEKVALVGQSGAGKSTALALLLRLYDVESGTITLDGFDIRDVKQDDLRRQVSMVRQETAMFNRSARDNIIYGRPDATEAEVIEAAKQAEAHEFILDLVDLKGRRGYDAYLGERGVKLSGGQRQRIALARAILKDAPVLALDEATSALDSEVEAAIQDSLATLMQGKTVIAVAHRLSTIAQMDRIVVMEAGRVVEMGSHAELLAKDGLYAAFWARQSGGFIGIKAAE